MNNLEDDGDKVLDFENFSVSIIQKSWSEYIQDIFEISGKRQTYDK